MTIYFTAADDTDAQTKLAAGGPAGDEVLTSAVAAEGNRFNGLIELVTGKPLDELGDKDYTVHVDVATDPAMSLARLGADLTTEIADYDADEFTDLAGPWERSDAFDDDTAADNQDPADFLTDLQHLCRNAVATNGAVYASENP